MQSASANSNPFRLSRLHLALALLCLAFGTIEALQSYLNNVWREDEQPVWHAFAYSWLPWIPIALLSPLIVGLARRWPLVQGARSTGYSVHVLAMFSFIVLHVSIVATSFVIGGVSPPNSIAFIKQLTGRSALDAVVYWSIVGATVAIDGARRARERERLQSELMASLAEARLTALRAQIDPHFLFNTLNAISVLALRSEPERVVEALSLLADLLRTSLDGTPTQQVALSDELAFLDRYLELQHLRFSDRLEVTRIVSDAALRAQIPAMLLQPLVENAVQHGVSNSLGAVRVNLDARVSGDTLTIEVQDNGPGFPSAPHNGIGLTNTRARLQQLYGANQSLTCGNVPGGGAMVRVSIPYTTIATPALVTRDAKS